MANLGKSRDDRGEEPAKAWAQPGNIVAQPWPGHSLRTAWQSVAQPWHRTAWAVLCHGPDVAKRRKTSQRGAVSACFGHRQCTSGRSIPRPRFSTGASDDVMSEAASADECPGGVAAVRSRFCPRFSMIPTCGQEPARKSWLKLRWSRACS